MNPSPNRYMKTTSSIIQMLFFWKNVIHVLSSAFQAPAIPPPCKAEGSPSGKVQVCQMPKSAMSPASSPITTIHACVQSQP